MLKSMTGYGKSVSDLTELKITVELKSLNSKNVNLTIKMPETFNEKEYEIRNLIFKSLERGKINLSVKIDSDSKNTVSLNEKVIKNYYEKISETVNSLGHNIHNEQVFQTILKMPEVISVKEEELDKDKWNKVLQVINDAVSELNKFRLQEGKALKIDILNNINNIVTELPNIEVFEKERIERLRLRLEQKINEFFNNQKYDADRFEQEIIYYIEKYDINEEKIRLKNHCNYFIKTIENEKSSGRKLGFIAQEIGREVNTLGAKANHYEIQKIIVLMKDNLEKIKEQLLNVL